MSKHAYNVTDPVEDVSHQIISSYFLGPKAENHEFFKNNINAILDAQREARLDYFPQDGVFVTDEVKRSAAFRKSSRRMTNAIRQASELLGKHSIPFWSPRYQGHMCMDLSMPALMGYFMTMLYNPNNVSIEASPFTTVVEMEVGSDLCKMFGFNVDPDKQDQPVAWGHITCDGSVANLESMWVARNLKYYPFSIHSAMKENGPLNIVADKFKITTCLGEEKLMKDLTLWELLNLRPDVILDIPERLYQEYRISPTYLSSVMEKYGIQSTGKSALEKEYGIPNPKYFVSNTKHYSWPKSGAVLGLGSDNIIGVAVDHGARVDMNDLRRKLEECLDKKTPVFAVVAIVGSTEEGSVDPLADIIKLRREFQERGLSFLVHADGAWGGYFSTMLPTGYQPGQEIALPSEVGSVEGFVPDSGLRTKTSEDLFMLREADSVTVDPHKAAYIPYPAGALCYRDGRMRYQVTWTCPYISRGEMSSTSIGVFGIEGSKPGAAAMSTWFSNKCIGLGPEGYGKLFSEVTFTCSRLAAEWAAMSTEKDSFKIVPLNELPSELKADATEESVEAERQRIRDQIISKTNYELVKEDSTRPDEEKALKLLRALGSDLNINAFSANWRYADGTLNDEVEEANYFNMRVIQRLSVDSPEDDPTQIPFYLTSTTFQLQDYGECAQHFKKRLGLYQDNVELVVMRNVVMSPWPTDGMFVERLIGEFRKVLEEEVEICRSRNDVSPTRHEFLLLGSDKLYAVHFPAFHLEKHRHQLIFEVDLPAEAKKTYLDAKKEEPSANFVLRTARDIAIGSMVADKATFEVSIYKGRHSARDPDEYPDTEAGKAGPTTLSTYTVSAAKATQPSTLTLAGNLALSAAKFSASTSISVPGLPRLAPDNSKASAAAQTAPTPSTTTSSAVVSKVPVTIKHILKHKSLKGRYRDIQYPISSFPFYLFGTSKSMCIEHILVRSPNTQLSAENVILDFHVDETALANGAILFLHGESEAARQPFQSTQGPLGDTLGSESNFFFRPGQKFSVSVYEDPRKFNEPGPGLLDGVEHWNKLGEGTMTLGEGRYVDSFLINKDPFEVLDGDEKFKAWKALLDSVGREFY